MWEVRVVVAVLCWRGLKISRHWHTQVPEASAVCCYWDSSHPVAKQEMEKSDR